MSTAIKAIILYQLELHGNVLFGIWWSFHANHSHGHVIRKCICLQLLCKWYSYFKWDVSGRNRLGCICESWFGISKQQPLFELLLLTFCLNWKPGLINRGDLLHTPQQNSSGSLCFILYLVFVWGSKMCIEWMKLYTFKGVCSIWKVSNDCQIFFNCKYSFQSNKSSWA